MSAAKVTGRFKFFRVLQLLVIAYLLIGKRHAEHLLTEQRHESQKREVLCHDGYDAICRCHRRWFLAHVAGRTSGIWRLVMLGRRDSTSRR